ncbi:MAG: PIN domain-containing protein [Methanoregula sp.]
MHLLVDTNILIYREDDRIISQNVRDLFELLQEIPVEIFIHPESVADVHRDRDARRREVMLSKIETYRQLQHPPSAAGDEEFIRKVGSPSSPQDSVDNEILYAVFRGASDFLLTEDAGIHRKAFAAGISDRVLHIDDAIQFFRTFVPRRERIASPPGLKEDFMYNLNIRDPIFDSLKRDYPGFERWFDEKSREYRKCFVSYRPDGLIGALLIYKFEDEPIDVTPPLPQKRRMKIATLKVTHVGNKIGELLLKVSFDLAIKNDCDEIFLTHFTEENDRLVELITEFGFVKMGVNSGGEEIFLKKLVAGRGECAGLSPVEILKRFYPSFYDGPQVKKWIIPIQPEFHARLFTDYGARQTLLHEHAGEFVIEGNTIKKAYLSHSRNRQLRAGDIVLFYRSRDTQSLTSLGVIEEVRMGLTQTDEIIRVVGKRTVYSTAEIDESLKPLTVILFRHHFHLRNPLNLATLLESGILNGPPQSIMQISDEKYTVIKTLGGIDGRFTVN